MSWLWLSAKSRRMCLGCGQPLLSTPRFNYMLSTPRDLPVSLRWYLFLYDDFIKGFYGALPVVFPQFIFTPPRRPRIYSSCRDASRSTSSDFEFATPPLAEASTNTRTRESYDATLTLLIAPSDASRNANWH